MFSPQNSTRICQFKKCHFWSFLLLQRRESESSCERGEEGADKVKTFSTKSFKLFSPLKKKLHCHETFWRLFFSVSKSFAAKHNSTLLQVTSATGETEGGDRSVWWECERGEEVAEDRQGGGQQQEQRLEQYFAKVKETKSEKKAEDWSCQEDAGEH